MTIVGRRRIAESVATALETGAAFIRRCGRATQDNRRTLVLGGVRSGKSQHAEQLLQHHDRVLYVPGSLPPDDSDHEWAERIATHRDRRPAHWHTVETDDLATTLQSATAPVLLDCLGTWVTRTLGDVGAWEDRAGWQQRLDEHIHAFLHAWRTIRVPIVAVSNEVGSGVVPATASGRAFRDVLGSLNTRVAASSDSIRLVVAGRSIQL